MHPWFMRPRPVRILHKLAQLYAALGKARVSTRSLPGVPDAPEPFAPMELFRLLLRAIGMTVTTAAMSLLVDAMWNVATGGHIGADMQHFGQMLTGTFMGAFVFFVAIDDAA